MRKHRKKAVKTATTKQIDWPAILGEAILIAIILLVPIVIDPWSRDICDLKDVILGLGVTLGLGAWTIASLARGRMVWASSRITLFVFAFTGWAGLSLIYSRYRYITISEFGRLAAHAGLYLLVLVTVQRIAQARRLLGAACVAAIVVCIYGFLQKSGHDFIPWATSTERIFSFLGNATFLASFLVLTIPLAVAIGWPRERSGQPMNDLTRRLRWKIELKRWLQPLTVLLLILIVAMLLCLYFSVTIAALIGLALGSVIILVLVFIRTPKALRIAAPIFIIGAILIVPIAYIGYRKLPSYQQGRIQQVLRFQDPYSAERQLHWRTALGIFREQPVIGMGYGTFRALSLERMSSEWYQLSRRHASEMLLTAYAHNIYLQMLADTGAVGVILLLLLIVAAFIVAGRIALKHPDREWGRLGLAFTAGGIAFLLQNFFGVTFPQTGAVTYFWVSLGVLAVAAAHIPGSGNKGEKPFIRIKQFRPFSTPALAITAVAVALALIVVGWVTIRPVEASIYLRKSQDLAKQGHLQEAARLADAALELCPYSTVGYYTIASIRGQLGDYEKSLDANKKALQLLPGNASVYYNLGVTYKYLRRWPEAEASFKRALELMPTNVENHAGMAEILVEEGKLLEAEKYANEALKLGPGNPKCYLLLADIEARQGNIKEALELIHGADKLAPNELHVKRSLAQLLLNSKQYDSAIKACREWIQLSPFDPQAYKLLGMCHLALPRYPEAKSDFERALELDPNDLTSRLNLSYVLGKVGDIAAARRELERVVQQGPNTLEGQKARGVLERLNASPLK